ncbi:MAG: hypothetical protein R3B13_26730 [Polyangiaceae bacterium]
MQLHFYLTDELAAEVQARAAQRGMAVSRFLAELVKAHLEPGWPADYFEAVVGRWEGPLERAAQGSYEARETL